MKTSFRFRRTKVRLKHGLTYYDACILKPHPKKHRVTPPAGQKAMCYRYPSSFVFI